MPTLYVSTPRFSRQGRHARTPSTMLSGHLVGTTRVSFNPASAKIAANSFLVRSPSTMLLDINMLVIGGRERTKNEFAAIFAEAGLKLTRVVPTKCPLSIVEGVRA